MSMTLGAAADRTRQARCHRASLVLVGKVDQEGCQASGIAFLTQRGHEVSPVESSLVHGRVGKRIDCGGPVMIVDCMTCPVRGERCDDCVVTMLLAPGPVELPLDAVESRAVSVLVGAGLVSAESAAGLRAIRVPVEQWGSVSAAG